MRPQSLVWALCIASAYMVLGGALAQFFIIGHMANNIETALEFLKEGANALHIDVQFNHDATPSNAYHGFPCDCGRSCSDKTPFYDYMKRIRDLRYTDEGYYKSLRMLMLDLKVGSIDCRYYQAGLFLVQAILESLWKYVPAEWALNVVLSIPATEYTDVFQGAMNAINEIYARNYSKNLGFAIDDFSEGAAEIDKAFYSAYIDRHRWIGTGITNCLPYLTAPEERNLLACRHAPNRCQLVDRAFHWTVDAETSITAVIRKGYDGVITNKPSVARDAVRKTGVRLAGFNDNPW